jgi:outer membrane protein OmpA-like peptidoglycan-associated protein
MVEGYADRLVGTGATQTQMDTNTSKEISTDRAQTVVNYLVNELGIAASRLVIDSNGQTSRTTYGSTLDAQKENRRVNIIFMYPEK